MRLNFNGDVTSDALVGDTGLFPFVLRDGGVSERTLRVVDACYDPAADRTVVELEQVEP